MTLPRHAQRDPEPAPGDERKLPKTRGRRVIHGDLSQLMAHPLGEAGVWVVLLAAAFVDIATFHQVLLLVMTNATTGTVWGVAIGFVAVALALAHYVGGRFKLSLAPGSATSITLGARSIALICFGIWSALGLISFLIRLLVNDGGQGGGTTFVVDGQPVDVGGGDEFVTRLLSALMFLALYVATGALSALAGWTRQTAARRWGRVRRREGWAERRYAVARADLVYAEQLLDAIEQERARRDTDLDSAMARCDAAASGLKQEIRLKLAKTSGDRAGNHRPERPGTDGK